MKITTTAAHYYSAYIMISFITLIPQKFAPQGLAQELKPITTSLTKSQNIAPIPTVKLETTAKFQKLNNFFKYRHQKGRFDGAVLVAENGNVVYENTFGYANRRKKTPFSINSSFQLASVSKPITATAVLMLIEKGKINLEDKVTKYYPNFPYPEITIKMLLTHRSGLSNYMYYANDYAGDVIVSNQDVMKMMETHKPQPYYTHNKKYNYSNTNYCILGAIIEKVSGQSFNAFMNENIFKPLNMDNSFAFQYADDNKTHTGVESYRANGRQVVKDQLDGVVGDKGIFASVKDLLKFDQALYNETLVSNKTLDLAYTPHNPKMKKSNYGLGWRMKTINDEKVIYHSGWWRGFKTHFVRLVDQNKTVIVLSNTTRGRFNINELVNLANKH